MIPYGRQDISQEDIDAVVEVLKSDWLTQGPRIAEFESAICEFTNAKFGVAVNSATSALHVACLALGVGKGDLVWTSPITFVASANCALYCGAEVDFVDVDPASGNMCPNALELKLQLAEKNNKLPKVIIPVHFCGHSCDMQSIFLLANKYGIKVIEDASHSIGGSYGGDKVGSCKYSDITVFSFHPVKIITSAEGGMALTNQAYLAEMMALYRSHGITKQLSKMLRPSEGDWYYEQQELGHNYRMTDIQAALGLSQLSRLESFVTQRNILADKYILLLKTLEVDVVLPLPDSISSWHLFVVKLSAPELRKKLFGYMREAGVQVHVHYYPVHLQPYYLNIGFERGDFPQAERFYEKVLTLPIFPSLTEAEQLEIISLIVNFLGAEEGRLVDHNI